MAFAPALTGTIIFALYAIIGSTKPKLSKSTIIFIATILALAAASTLWSVSAETSKEKFLKLLILLPPQILLISLATSLTKEQLSPLKKAFPIGLLIASIVLCTEIITGGILYNFIRGNPLIIATDPDNFNRACVGVALYSFASYGILGTCTHKLRAFLIAFTPIFVALYMTESLSSQLCMCVGLLFLFAFPYKYKISFKILKFMMIALIFSAPFIISDIYYTEAMTIQNLPLMQNGYAGHRLEIWDYVSRYGMQSPIWGHGIEVTRTITDFDSKLMFYEDNLVLHPHNFVMQIWLEFGLLGIAIASFFMYFALTTIEKKFTIAQQKILLPTFMATLVPAAFAYGLWQGLWVGLIFHVAAIALMAATLNSDNAKSENRTPP